MLLEETIKQLYELKREEVAKKIKQIIKFPFHPDTKVILFYLDIYQGIYSITPIPMDRINGTNIRTDAYGTEVSGLKKLNFAWMIFDYLSIQLDEDEDDYDEELANKARRIAKKELVNFLQSVFDDVGGHDFHLPCVIRHDEASEAYVLQHKRWIKEEEFDEIL